MKRLEPLVGKWKLETRLADVQAIASFEWILGGLFLLQRTEVDHPERPTAIPQAFLINRRRNLTCCFTSSRRTHLRIVLWGKAAREQSSTASRRTSRST